MVVVALSAGRSVEASSPEAAQDFDAAWTFIRDHYCFFPDGPAAWNEARSALRPRAIAATTKTQTIRVLEDLLDQLADPHAHLRVNLASSHRLIPHDVWGSRSPDGLLLEAVRSGSRAQAAGVRPGDVVIAINGRPALEVADAVRPKHSPRSDAVLDQWSALIALAGRHDTPRMWRVRSGDVERVVDVDHASAPRAEEAPLVSAEELSDAVGLIRIRSFADPTVVPLFDAALDRFLHKAVLIVDVRDNHGGDTAIARPIMGRFIDRRKPYALMRRREGDGLGRPWTEYVEPRGPQYPGRVAVLVDRFSASMAEGFAMGMRTIAGATLVGTKMAGLGAAVAVLTLPNSGYRLQISAEPVYTVEDRPRWTLEPDILVSLQQLRSSEDAILETALRWARQAAAPKDLPAPKDL
ncbi:MAG: hypothetical protein D6824_04185, partial [Planctomycetota bacterium]